MVGVRDTDQSHQSPTEVGERADGSTALLRHTKSEQSRQSEGDPKVILMLCESGGGRRTDDGGCATFPLSSVIRPPSFKGLLRDNESDRRGEPVDVRLATDGPDLAITKEPGDVVQAKLLAQHRCIVMRLAKQSCAATIA